MSQSYSRKGFLIPFRYILFAVFSAALFLTPAIRPVVAQQLFGSIVGSITDSSGAAVPGATVTVTQLETNDSRETKTNEAGGLTLSTIWTGTYRVSVTKEGFKTYTVDTVSVSVNTVVRVDAGLQVGASSQSIEISAVAAPLQTDKADVHVEFNTKQLVDLPQPTRQFGGIAALVPGIAPPIASSGGNNNPSKSFQITADGTSRSGTNTLIDGVSAVNPWVQVFASYAPSVEAIETVSIVTASSGADQGMTNGASINVQTKGGSNDIHGSLYEYHINSAMKARPFFLPSNQGIPKLVSNDFGATLGGRIIKNKLFYFASYERDTLRQGSGNSTITVPTAAIIAGDLSASPTPIYDPATGTYGANGNPSGRTQFPGNIIPASRISPVAKKMTALLPAPNQNISATPANNYYVSLPISNTLQHIDTRFDWVATEKFKVTGRYGYQPYNITQPPVFGDILGGTPNQPFQDGYANAYAVNATYVFSPTFIIDGNWGRTYAHQTLSPASTDKRVGLDIFGIPGANSGALPYAGSLAQMNISNFTSYGENFTPLQYDDPIYQYAANATWNKGRHNVRFGINTSRQHMSHFETQPVPGFFFTGNSTTLGQDGLNPNAFNSYADFLLGLPNRIINTIPTPQAVTLHTWQHSIYVQDTWQVSRKLTLNFGTAWEYYPIPSRGNRQIETYDFASNRILQCGQGSIPSNCGITVSKTLFAPRFGIAYRPSESWVIRAGYSLSPEQINMFRDGIYNYPTVLTTDQSGTSIWKPVGSFETGFPVPPQPIINNGVVTPPPGTLLGAIIPQNTKFVRGYTESMNFSIQKDLGRGWVGQVAYVGTLSIHQHTRYNVNYATTINGGTSSQVFAPLGITGALSVILPYETMRYNSLQAQLNHRFSSGFLFGAAYTRSKWIGLCCDDSGDGGPAITLPAYTKLNRALMSADRPDNLRLSGTYDLPFGKGQKFASAGVANQILGGWHLNSIFSAYSGSPFSASGGNLNTPGFTQRANQVKADVNYLGNVGNGQLFFDTSAFVPAPTGVIGNAGYNTLRGPGVINVDASVFRDFKPTERFTVQFRAEALNALNTPHFSNPNGNVTATTYGQVTGVSAASRIIDERYLRLSLRIKF